MALVTIREISIGFGGPPLLDQISCQIEPGQHIGLLGRNGAGKSTLLRILCGQIDLGDGEVVLSPGASVSLLPQDVPHDVQGRIHDVVHAGLPRRDDGRESNWRDEQRVERILSRMQLDAHEAFETQSSGMKRRVLLARALVAEPDLLLLDEPTNHLDIDAIDWVERFLSRWNGTLMFVTHDRMFLRRLADRILELDRGKLFDWSCDYDTFLKRKEAALAAEDRQNVLFDKKLAEEEVWIRQGIKARRTRNEGRVRALQRMRQERNQRRTDPGKVRMELRQELRSGNLVAHAKKVSFAYGDRTIINEFSTAIMRGDKIGIMGPNGAGKTTLLRVLLGQLPPTQGSIRLGTNLQIAYFDQLRAQLDDDKTVQECVGDGNDWVRVGGEKRHIIGYLQDFLFTPERSRTLIRFASGGERNRVLLARLFAKPANVVVLDEPTNDLDTETLELLEELLAEYPGTVLLVSHDRAFLNNVVTSTIVFEGDEVKEYAGGYDDWLRQRSKPAGDTDTQESSRNRLNSAPPGKTVPTTVEGQPNPQARRLTYNEKRELEALPLRIEQLESEVARLHNDMSAPEFYKRPSDEIASETATLRQLEDQLTDVYQRWEELEERSV